MPLGIVPRHLQRQRIDIGRHRDGIRPIGENRNRNTSRSGPQIDEPPAFRQRLQGQVDQQFRIGSRFERRRVEREIEPVKFLVPDDSRHRFTGQPPIHQFGDVRC